MALFHFHATQIKRSAGQSAIAAAAYRAGEKLLSLLRSVILSYPTRSNTIHQS